MTPGLRLELVGRLDTLELTDYTPLVGDVFATSGLDGAGFPDVEHYWFDGAGDGQAWRGARVQPRDLTVPIEVTGPDRAAVAAVLRRLALILDPHSATPPRLRVIEPDRTAWSLGIQRVGRADWAWGPGTNSRTWVKTALTFRAGDPYWTRESSEKFVVSTVGSTAGLLSGSLAELNLTAGQAFGEREVTNAGDAEAFVTWTLTGPGDHFEAVGADGELLAWDGALAEGERLTIDSATGEVTDGTGANRYDELGPAPRFWTVNPGKSTVSVTFDNASPGRLEAAGVNRTNLAVGSGLRRSVTTGTWSWTTPEPGTLRVECLTNTQTTWSDAFSVYLHQILSTDPKQPVAVGDKFTFGCEFRYGPTYARRHNLRRGVALYDASGSVIGFTQYASGSHAVPSDAGLWVQTRFEYTITDPSAVTAVFRLQSQSAGASPSGFDVGDWMEMRRFYMFRNQSADPIFDGDTLDTSKYLYAWSGTANASPSLETTLKRVGATEILAEWAPRRWVMF